MQLWLMLLVFIRPNVGSLSLDSGFVVPALSFVNQETWLL